MYRNSFSSFNIFFLKLLMHIWFMFTTRTRWLRISHRPYEQQRARQESTIKIVGKFTTVSKFLFEYAAGEFHAFNPRINFSDSYAGSQYTKFRSKSNAFSSSLLWGGGTGSGFGSLLLSSCRDQFPGTIISTQSIFPSQKNHWHITTYPCFLSFFKLAKN